MLGSLAQVRESCVCFLFLENRIELCLEFLHVGSLCHFLKSTSPIIGARIEMAYLFAVLFDYNNKNFENGGGRNP